ncbi:hypothetical protein PULV_a1873 [Pseudoalteromonas ulvae UL12]|nr:hypothetical protein [Pseudoalteromonas ulvae UL12]
MYEHQNPTDRSSNTLIYNMTGNKKAAKRQLFLQHKTY